MFEYVCECLSMCAVCVCVFEYVCACLSMCVRV